jgi:hypothetical protein
VAEVSEDEVHAVIEWLRTHYFEHSGSRDGGGLGDHLEEWANGRDLVRIVRDGEQWWVNVGRDGWDDWFDIDLVNYVVDTREDTVVGRVAAVSRAELDHLLPALIEARGQQAAHRLGVPPRHPYT